MSESSRSVRPKASVELSPEAESILGLMRQAAEMIPSTPSLDSVRGTSELFGMLTGPVEGVTVEVADLDGVSALWQTPPEAEPGAVLVYLHGGGYVSGSAVAWQQLVNHLAAATRFRAVNLDYRLAPEHPFPAALDDSCQVYRWLVGQGFSADKIVLAGDSAGAGLALAMLLRLRDEGKELPAAAVLFSPYTDATMSGGTLESNRDCDLLFRHELARFTWDCYLKDSDEDDLRHPYVSPVFGDFSGLPPLMIQVGEAECLLDDARTVAQRAAAAGVDVTLEICPQMQHIFQVAAGNMPEADDALTRAAAFLRSRLGFSTPRI